MFFFYRVPGWNARGCDEAAHSGAEDNPPSTRPKPRNEGGAGDFHAFTPFPSFTLPRFLVFTPQPFITPGSGGSDNFNDFPTISTPFPGSSSEGLRQNIHGLINNNFLRADAGLIS